MSTTPKGAEKKCPSTMYPAIEPATAAHRRPLR
jgi:hypothetical protein